MTKDLNYNIKGARKRSFIISILYIGLNKHLMFYLTYVTNNRIL